MKNTYLLLLIPFISGLSGCTKQDSPIPENEKTYNVDLLVSDFSVSEEGIKGHKTNTSAVGDTLANHVKYLYAMFKDDGEDRLEQVSTSPDFGKISVKLKPGTYTAYLAASKGELGFDYGTPGPVKAYPKPDTQWEDTFHASVTITVGNSNITQNVRLKRVVGAIELNIKDAIPSNVFKITLAVFDAHSFSMSDGSPINGKSRMKTFMLAESDKGVPNKKYLMHNLAGSSNSTHDVSITAYNAQGDIVMFKQVKNVPSIRNQKTILSGTLFADYSVLPSITVDPTWGTQELNF